MSAKGGSVAAPDGDEAPSDLSLLVRRTIAASPEQLFAAWTEPAHLERWWGPRGVRCTGAEIDLRIGGRYRIGNELPDGRVVWIAGEFEQIEPPCRLVFSWRIEPAAEAVERVTIRFEERAGGSTEVIIAHERIADAVARDTHEQGWNGCLDGLSRYTVGGN